MKKNKKLQLCGLVILFLLSAGLVMAVEVPLPGLGENPTLARYVEYFFTFIISIAGIISLISFTIGAISLMVSADRAESASNAKDRMKGAVLGLVLTVTAFLIIQTINPQLTNFTIERFVEQPGVYIVSSRGRTACASAYSTVPQGSQEIIYSCSQAESQAGAAYLVWKFPRPGLEGGNGNLSGATVARMACGQRESLGGVGSFKIARETPGVYYFLGAGCAGYGSVANTTDQNYIGNAFAGKVRSVKIINGSNLYYGAIFHEVQGLTNGGTCTAPIINSGEGNKCENITISASAANIFRLNKDWASPGDGVVFYSEPFGPDRGSMAGFYEIFDEDISLNFQEDPDNMDFDYTGIRQPDAYQDRYVTFQDKPGSIDIRGGYIVGLYSNNNYCQTFTENVPNLNSQPVTRPGSPTLTDIRIVPIQR